MFRNSGGLRFSSGPKKLKFAMHLLHTVSYYSTLLTNQPTNQNGRQRPRALAATIAAGNTHHFFFLLPFRFLPLFDSNSFYSGVVPQANDRATEQGNAAVPSPFFPQEKRNSHQQNHVCSVVDPFVPHLPAPP